MLHHELGPVSAFALATLLLGACTPAPTAQATASANPSAASAPAGSAPSVSPSAAPSGPVVYPVATGPRLAVVAGQGVGAIRLGASVATVERLMELPCDEKTPTLCRYHARAVEFQFDAEGKLRRIVAHRQARKAGAATYGLFNGAIPPDLMFGMIPAAIQQHLGPPERVVEGNEGAAPEAFQQHVYKGMVLEYDKISTGRTVLGGVRIPD